MIPRWQPGRQGGTYSKLTLFAGRRWLPVDAHLIRYGVGDFVAAHTDSVDGRRHYRLNIELRRARCGGFFYAYPRSAIVFWRWRVVLFRPDLATHAVTQVKRGTRLVLSFGWAIGVKNG
jgi:hypothetical protein